MQTDKHTSETVWTWTINELCRKVETVDPQAIYEWYQKNKIDLSQGIAIAQ